MKYYYWVFTTMLILAGISCQKDNSAEAESVLPASSIVVLTRDQEETSGLTLGAAKEKMFSSTFEVKGSIEVPPQNRISVSAPMGGYLRSTTLLPGMRVKKGQKIAVLEDRMYIELLENYEASKSKLAWISSDYERQKELLKSNSVSEKIFQESAYQFTQQKILVEALAEKLRLVGINPQKSQAITRFLPLFSPINGIVEEIHANIGKYIQPTDVLFDLVDPSDIHLSLHVFEQDVDKLHAGQVFEAYTNVNPARKYSGTVLVIASGFSADRTVNVQCHFGKYHPELVPGMYMNVTLARPTQKSWALPSAAIIQRGAQQWAYYESKPQEYRRILVRGGEEKAGWVPIQFPEGFDPSPVKWVTAGAYALYMMQENTE